jgi:hypothetical protein
MLVYSTIITYHYWDSTTHRTYHENIGSNCYYRSNIAGQISIVVYLTHDDIMVVYLLSIAK